MVYFVVGIIKDKIWNGDLKSLDLPEVIKVARKIVLDQKDKDQWELSLLTPDFKWRMNNKSGDYICVMKMRNKLHRSINK
jgi:hypothetical protein